MHKIEKPTVKLIGEDGNAFVILGRITAALRKAGYKEEYIEKYQEESMSGDYDNLLVTATKYVNIE